MGSDAPCGTAPGLRIDFNPRSPCGERRDHHTVSPPVRDISIHAPRVGSDHLRAGVHQLCDDFNPRSPCGERHVGHEVQAAGDLFQSTLPVWGATLFSGPGDSRPDISIHAPRVGSDFQNRGYCVRRSIISIHAPRVGSDLQPPGVVRRGAISIHAPRVGSDARTTTHDQEDLHFNPRSPCGERRFSPRPPPGPGNFNPRSPCGERPEADILQCEGPIHFNPRSPCGERRAVGRPRHPILLFQSTLPVWGATICRS